MRCRTIYAALCLALIPLTSNALSDGYKTHFKKNLLFMSQAKSKYVWGAKGDVKDGIVQVDCSGYVYAAANRAGMPVKRTTSLRMSMGLDGWNSKKVTLDEVDETDMCFFTWKTSPQRPNGHVGVLIVSPSSGLLEVSHASSSKGMVTFNQLRASFLRDLTVTRALTFGDKGQTMGKDKQ